MPLRRPVVSKVGLFTEWPLILIDLYTNEGVVGHSYLEPYLKHSSRYIIPAIEDLVAAQVGKRLAPLDSFQASRRSLNLVGYEGITTIAVAGIDMAIWDALAKAAGMPLAVMLGRSLGSVPAYNSNGLWLSDVSTLAKETKELVAEGQFNGLKLRLGRDRLADDLAALRAVREGAGDEIRLMVDFNQGLSLGDALARCHALDDAGLYWFEEPIAGRRSTTASSPMATCSSVPDRRNSTTPRARPTSTPTTPDAAAVRWAPSSSAPSGRGSLARARS